MLLILAGCFAPRAQAGWLDWKTSTPGEKIQFSAPTASGSASNAPQSETPAANPLDPGAFDRIKEQLFGPLEKSIKSADSTSGVMNLPPPQQQPRPLDKRTREMNDRKKNWAFTDLNELNSDPTAGERPASRTRR